MPEPEFDNTRPDGLTEEDYVAACWEALARDQDAFSPEDDDYFLWCYQERLPVWRAIDNLKIPF